MWIGIDDAEILIEDLLFEEERVDLRVSFLGEGATARAKDKVWDDAIISVFFLNIYICVCVCVLWYIYVCEVKIFLPFKKKGTIERKTQHVSHFLSNLSLKSFTFRLFEKKRKKKSRIKKALDFFQNFTPFCFSLRYYILRGIILSLRVYHKERVGEKGEDKRV